MWPRTCCLCVRQSISCLGSAGLHEDGYISSLAGCGVFFLFFFFFFPGNSINQAGSKIHLLQIDGNKWKIDNDHKCKQKKNAEFPNVKRSIYLELVD